MITVGSSPVLSAFVAAAATVDPARGGPLQFELEANLHLDDERDLLNRVLTSAARAMSKTIGEAPRTTLITSGDAAFQELMQFKPEPESSRGGLYERFAKAMELATDRLGPFRGGERASAKAPADAPEIVEEFSPSEQDMLEMAHASGVVVGTAGATGRVDSLHELRAALESCPTCGAAAFANGATSTQVPGAHETIEFGACVDGHHLARPVDSASGWHAVEDGEPWAAGSPSP